VNIKEARARVLNADNHYAVLGVAPGAAPDVIKAAHRTLARAFHPDLCKLEDAHDLCARVNGAYAVLGDKEARRKYDAVERTEEAQCTRCAGTGTVYKQKGFNKKVTSPCPTCGGSGICASQ
jgi:DnaJ-class molecular chaperone